MWLKACPKSIHCQEATFFVFVVFPGPSPDGVGDCFTPVRPASDFFLRAVARHWQSKTQCGKECCLRP